VQVGGALKGKVAVSVACGRCHTAVVTEEGALYTFGQGDNGQLGLASDKDEIEPIQVPLRSPPNLSSPP
jgi:alpha-tubulin suppressor-like RCC1 family protein